MLQCMSSFAQQLEHLAMPLCVLAALYCTTTCVACRLLLMSSSSTAERLEHVFSGWVQEAATPLVACRRNDLVTLDLLMTLATACFGALPQDCPWCCTSDHSVLVLSRSMHPCQP